MQFDTDFFKDEYRCDFFIPQMMKRAWAAKLELLQIIINICDKHHLTYFATCGTLLGAVRHKGFIPWDDDIDIALKRQDYAQLIQILPDELPAGFVLGGLYAQNESFFLPTYQSLVVTVPSFWTLSAYMNRFHGFPYRQMGIDIFPLDYYPEDADAGQVQKYLIRKIAFVVNNWDTFPSSTREQHIKELESLCNVKITSDKPITQTLLQLQDSIRTLYSASECRHFASNSVWFRNAPLIPEEWYSETLSVPFENINLTIPAHYDDILSQKYGDYMTPVISHITHTYPFYKKEEQSVRKYLDSHGYFDSIDTFVKQHYTD